MEQKDYLLREIEKIRFVLQAILGKMIGGKIDSAVEDADHFAQTNELLIDNVNLDLEKLMTLNDSETKEYINTFEGLSIENLEMLSDVLYHLGLTDKVSEKRLFFHKALQILDICNKTDKTFSFERENKIRTINSELKKV